MIRLKDILNEGETIRWKKTTERGKGGTSEIVYLTQDRVYKISFGFVGDGNGYKGEDKELGWYISKKAPNGDYVQSTPPKGYRSLKDAQKHAQNRADHYGYDKISVGHWER